MPKFNCIHCGQHIDAPDEMSGMNSNCPTCSGAIQVPGDPLHQPKPLRVRIIDNSKSESHTTNQELIDSPTKKSNNTVIILVNIWLGFLTLIAAFSNLDGTSLISNLVFIIIWMLLANLVAAALAKIIVKLCMIALYKNLNSSFKGIYAMILFILSPSSLIGAIGSGSM